jgi:hypothetical protein
VVILVWIHSIYLPPTEVLSGVPQGSVLGLHLFIYLFITVLCSFIKHSKYFLFADTIKISHSISSVTYGTLPQCDIDSVRGRCAADFVNLNTDKTKVRSTMLTTYCLNQSKHWDSHVLWPTLRLLLIFSYCYITP